ncbi:MAG: GNAT family N-acetyltransferase [Proteobacteria bacterium]|nr:GNAT family N-acetyltransferase [Pseudomonadota bacterium]MBU1649969.1 GNAT family N-acetyltransferase [Pseudomonadota bacterium]
MAVLREEIIIRAMRADDAEAVAGIYNHYITQTIITFEEEAVSSSEISQRLQNVQSSSLPWFVAEQAGEVVGYAYADKWKGRCAFRFSMEVTVYVSPDKLGYGIGTRLYRKMFPALRECGIHVAIAGIALPNEGSRAVHEKFGFTKVAHFKEVGFKFDRWIDVGYWQLIL